MGLAEDDRGAAAADEKVATWFGGQLELGRAARLREANSWSKADIIITIKIKRLKVKKIY